MATTPDTDRYEPKAFGRGTLHVQHARDANWKPGFRGFFDYRDLGMVEKTGGKLRAHVHRPNGPCQGAGDLHYHQLDFQMVYVLKCWPTQPPQCWKRSPTTPAPRCCRWLG